MFGNFFGRWFGDWFGRLGEDVDSTFSRVSRISLFKYNWSEVHSDRISERQILLFIDRYNTIDLIFSDISPILEVNTDYSWIQPLEATDSEIQERYYKITRFI